MATDMGRLPKRRRTAAVVQAAEPTVRRAGMGPQRTSRCRPHRSRHGVVRGTVTSSPELPEPGERTQGPTPRRGRRRNIRDPPFWNASSAVVRTRSTFVPGLGQVVEPVRELAQDLGVEPCVLPTGGVARVADVVTEPVERHRPELQGAHRVPYGSTRVSQGDTRQLRQVEPVSLGAGPGGAIVSDHSKLRPALRAVGSGSKVHTCRVLLCVTRWIRSARSSPICNSTTVRGHSGRRILPRLAGTRTSTRWSRADASSAGETSMGVSSSEPSAWRSPELVTRRTT